MDVKDSGRGSFNSVLELKRGNSNYHLAFHYLVRKRKPTLFPLQNQAPNGAEGHLKYL